MLTDWGITKEGKKKKNTSVGAPDTAIAAILDSIIRPNEWQFCSFTRLPSVSTVCINISIVFLPRELRSDLGDDCVDCSCWLPYNILNSLSATKTNSNYSSAFFISIFTPMATASKDQKSKVCILELRSRKASCSGVLTTSQPSSLRSIVAGSTAGAIEIGTYIFLYRIQVQQWLANVLYSDHLSGWMYGNAFLCPSSKTNPDVSVAKTRSQLNRRLPDGKKLPWPKFGPQWYAGCTSLIIGNSFKAGIRESSIDPGSLDGLRCAYAAISAKVSLPLIR